MLKEQNQLLDPPKSSTQNLQNKHKKQKLIQDGNELSKKTPTRKPQQNKTNTKKRKMPPEDNWTSTTLKKAYKDELQNELKLRKLSASGIFCTYHSTIVCCY